MSGPAALEDRVTQAFGAGGPLARSDPRFARRDAQIEMAQAVATAIRNRDVLVAEAGTGVGKTYAYLVPVLLSGARVLISTATKSLQDQLFVRDLPRLRKVLGIPASVALLKGRSNYLCRQRLAQSRTATLPDRWAARQLARVEQWAAATTSGDLAEVDGLDERSPVIPLITSTRENCLGTECPDHRACHVMKARRDAMAADVVVVNHHLFFADVLLRESGVAELLPSVDVAVFDEAHQLAEAGVQFLGTTLGSAQLLDFARDFVAAGLAHARGLQAWRELAGRVEHAARELRLAAAGIAPGDAESPAPRSALKLRWEARSGSPEFIAALAEASAACEACATALGSVETGSPDLARIGERAVALSRIASGFAGDSAPGRVRWIDLSAHQARLVESPLDIREAMREQIGAAPKAWIFTSATLGDDARLSWFSEGAGLQEPAVLRLGSPYDYAANARLYVPRRFPRPNEAAHPAAVAALAARCVRSLGGRTFVLTTTLRALAAIGAALRDELPPGGIDVLVQGSAPKRALIERYRADPGSVLVGSQSFWEGIDVPGDALQCVVIDKLPFPPPHDPLVEARVRRLESEGRNAFDAYFVAEAAVSLKQGAGRLIRSETDRGLLVVCDPRLATMRYGRRLLAALPPMPIVAGEAQALQWLAQLAFERGAAGEAPRVTTAATTVSCAPSAPR